MRAEFDVVEHRARRPSSAEVLVLAVSGEIDSSNVAEFEALVARRGDDGALVLDLTSVIYCDSAGFACLDRILASRDVAVVFGPHNPVRHAARIMGLATFESVDLAIDSFANT